MIERGEKRAFQRRSALAVMVAALAVCCLAVLFLGARALAQEAPSVTIQNDCTAFAIAPDNTLAFAVARTKRFDKILIERDEVWVAGPRGKAHMILDPDKFMPVPPPTTYVVQSMNWSPDSEKLSLSMLTKTYPWAPKVKGKKKGDLDDDDIDNTYDDNNTGPSASSSGNAIALLDQDGHEIKVALSKTRFIEGGVSGTWLADGKTFVYLNGSSQMTRVVPGDGRTSQLFDGKRFEGVAWDAARNRAFAVGEGLTPQRGPAIVQLGLLDETISVIAHIDDYKSSLTVSPLGDAIGYYSDGDTIEVRKLANPTKVQSLHTGPGRFEFDRNADRILLKRGSAENSNDLVWVRLNDGNFSPILHDLIYHDFHIAPDGMSLGVEDVGRGTLRIYPLEE